MNYRSLPPLLRTGLNLFFPHYVQKLLHAERRAKAAHNLRKYLARTGAANPSTKAAEFSPEYHREQAQQHKQFLQLM